MRLRLNYADLALVRFTPAINVFSETLISAQMLMAPGRRVAFAGFDARHDTTAPQARLLRHLIPVSGTIPDFLTPANAADSIDEALHAIRSTTTKTITADVRAAYHASTPSLLRRELAAGDQGTVMALIEAARWYYTRVLAPAWPLLEMVVRADIARRALTMAAAGIDGVLNTLHPGIRWDPPLLRVDTVHDLTVDLDGRGLTLAPWPLAGPRPRLLLADDQPAFLMYPTPLPDAPAVADQALDILMGRTRANVLRLLAVAQWCTTTELANRLGISIASASTHAAALRAARLIETVRAGRAVRHQITRLGADLAAAVPQLADGTPVGSAPLPVL